MPLVPLGWFRKVSGKFTYSFVKSQLGELFKYCWKFNVPIRSEIVCGEIDFFLPLSYEYFIVSAGDSSFANCILQFYLQPYNYYYQGRI
jgi:hypothetical protein